MTTVKVHVTLTTEGLRLVDDLRARLDYGRGITRSGFIETLIRKEASRLRGSRRDVSGND